MFLNLKCFWLPHQSSAPNKNVDSLIWNSCDTEIMSLLDRWKQWKNSYFDVDIDNSLWIVWVAGN